MKETAEMTVEDLELLFRCNDSEGYTNIWVLYWIKPWNLITIFVGLTAEGPKQNPTDRSLLQECLRTQRSLPSEILYRKLKWEALLRTSRAGDTEVPEELQELYRENVALHSL